MSNHDPAVERAAERRGALAASQGRPSSDNPYGMGRDALRLAWSQGYENRKASLPGA